MPSATTKGVPYPVGTDAAASLDTIVQSFAEWVDGLPGIASVTTAERNALAGAALWTGRTVYNNQTQRVQVYNGSVWTDDVAAVGTNALVDLAVTTAKINNLAVAAGKLADSAVTEIKIADGVVTNVKLASGIDAAKLTTGTLPIARILDGAVTNAKLASGIDAAKLTTGTLPIARVADGAVTNAKLASGIDAAKLTTGTLPSARIGGGSVTNDKIAVAPGGSSGGVRWLRLGNLVFVYTNSVAGNATGVNIPAGYRPTEAVTSVGVPNGSAAAPVRITTAGAIEWLSGTWQPILGAWSMIFVYQAA